MNFLGSHSVLHARSHVSACLFILVRKYLCENVLAILLIQNCCNISTKKLDDQKIVEP